MQGVWSRSRKRAGANLSKLEKYAETHFTPSGEKPGFFEEFFLSFSQDPLMDEIPEELRVDGVI
jgi:hypothetical protein